jgi:hypothetical protein
MLGLIEAFLMSFPKLHRLPYSICLRVMGVPRSRRSLRVYCGETSLELAASSSDRFPPPESPGELDLPKCFLC